MLPDGGEDTPPLLPRSIGIMELAKVLPIPAAWRWALGRFFRLSPHDLGLFARRGARISRIAAGATCQENVKDQSRLSQGNFNPKASAI